MVVDFFVCFWLLVVIIGEVDTIPIKESWNFDLPRIKAESLFPAIQSLSRRTKAGSFGPGSHLLWF